MDYTLVVERPTFSFEISRPNLPSFSFTATAYQAGGSGVSLPIPIEGVSGLQDQLTTIGQDLSEVEALAQTNQLNLLSKVDTLDYEETATQVEDNRLAILDKVSNAALAALSLVVQGKADQSYVNEEIANLVGTDAQVLAAIQALSEALAESGDLLEALEYTVANRVRFDVDNQALTSLQKNNARTNIGAEEIGEAARLIALITAASIGAATALQGQKADTALQSADVAPVALSGLFSSLANQIGIFAVVYSTYTAGENSTIGATDSLGAMLGKLQAQITALQASLTTYAYTTINNTYRNIGLLNGNNLSAFGSNLVYPLNALHHNDLISIEIWVKTSGSITGTVQCRLAVNGGSYDIFWSENLNSNSTTRLMKIKASIVVDYSPNTSSIFPLLYINNDGSTKGAFTEKSYTLSDMSSTQQLTLDFNLTNAGGLSAGAEYAIMRAVATVYRPS